MCGGCKFANDIDGPVLVWCNLNDESEMLSSSINGAVEVSGSDKPEVKGITHHWIYEWQSSRIGHKAQNRRFWHELAALPQHDFCWSVR